MTDMAGKQKMVWCKNTPFSTGKQTARIEKDSANHTFPYKTENCLITLFTN